MLASLPESEAPAVLGALADAGYTAARIGTILPGPPVLTLR